MAWWNPFKPSPPKPTPSAGDSGSIYGGSQPAPVVSGPVGPPPQVGSLNPSTPSTGGSSGGTTIQQMIDVVNSGGSSGGGSSGSSGGSSGGTTIQQMINAVNTAQQTIQQQSQQSTGPNLPSTQSLSAQSLGLGVAGTGQMRGGTIMSDGRINLYDEVRPSSFWKKAQDAFVAGLGAIGLSGGMKATASEEVPFITSGQTRDTQLLLYSEKQQQIETNFWKKGGPINPVNVVQTGKAYFDLRKSTREATANMQNALNEAYFTKFTPESQYTTLLGAGFSPSDVKFVNEKKVWSEVSTDPTTGDISNTTYTQITKGVDVPEFTFGNLRTARAGYLSEQDRKGQAYKELALGATWNIGEFGVKALALNKLGIVGGPATEGGLLGQTLTTGLGYAPKLAKVADFAMNPTVLLTGVGIAGGVGGYQGYKLGTETGLNKFATAGIGAGESVGKVYAFTAGATGGQISPIKVQSYQLTDTMGKSKTLSTLSIGGPFSGKYTALGSRLGGKVRIGYMPSKNLAGMSVKDTTLNQIAFGTPEGESLIRFYGKGSQEYKVVTGAVKTLRGVNIENPNVNLMSQKTFSSLSKAQQMQWSKEIQGLGSASSASGFRRFTGSITGVYKRPAGDIDVALGARASDKFIASDIAGRMGKGFSTKQGQIYFRGTKVFEGLTPENAIPQPLGYFGRFAQRATISGVGTGTTKTLVTPAGQSLTELGSAIRFPTGFGPTGQLTFGADKTQRVVDFAVTAERLSSASGRRFDVAGFKSVYGAKYPGIDWSQGQVVSTIGSSAGSASVSSSSVPSIAMAVFAPEGASSTSANVKAFIPARVSTSSRSSFSIPSLPSISSFSSPSSISSMSSRSSRSSPSSISSISSISSRSSISSISSISSRSSSSSSSSISSITGFPGSFAFLPPVLPRIGFTKMSGPTFRSRGPRRYTASLGAILKGVKAPKITGNIKFAEATGFLARPVVGGSRKRTSGKKRKK